MSEEVKRYDPIEFYDTGGSGRGQMECREDGDYVEVEDYERLERELTEVKEGRDQWRAVAIGLASNCGSLGIFSALEMAKWISEYNKLKEQLS